MEILVVDDNATDRLLARRGIERAIAGARVREAGTPAELEAALAGPGPDVAVLDFALGWSDGLEVFRRLRALYPDCGVVVFSGSLGEEGAVAVMRAGVDDYIVKDPSRVPRLAATVEGLAARVADRRARRLEAARTWAARRTTAVGMLTCAADGAILSANPAAEAMLDAGGDGLGGGNLLRLLAAGGLPDAWAAPGGPAIGGMEVAFGQGRFGLLDAHAVPAAGGQVECVLAEVTTLRAALTRANTLLSEVHHRVYNNLQVVDSLLHMESAQVADPAASEAFVRVSGRLRALALVQQRLHRGDDFGTVDFSAYLGDLADAVGDARPGQAVEVRAEAEPGLRLPVDTAMPLGLVATELLTNAMKHAFPGRRRGTVTVGLARVPGGVRLTVSDDGVGTAAAAPGGRQGQGGRLVRLLADQVGARVRASPPGDPGTTVTVDVPLGPP